ncbi:MAG: hypothetical protein RL518_2663 [Pseudomonadota bacterium]|jgi:hypothetical protein
MRSTASKFDTAENLLARDKALAIWNSAPVDRLPFSQIIEMIYHAQDSAVGSRAEGQFRAERRILEEVKSSHNPATLKDFRELFVSRAFSVSDIQRWMASTADILAMTADSLVQGYPEFLVASAPSSFRPPATLIEAHRRRYIDKNPEFGAFTSFYSDAGKKQ